ncbi:hypothetical protein ACTHGU_13350 [Chitinophagaceae bacterium MMS25-I14]
MAVQEQNMIQQLAGDICAELANVLSGADDELYTRPSMQLSRASIGQHVRHIIELFQCMETGYKSGIVNYEQRKRDTAIEKDRQLAVALLLHIQNHMHLHNKDIILECNFGNNEHMVSVTSNYFRELIYNTEHAIHHMALIRIAIQEHTNMVLPESFGVAPATIQYRKSCAQ